MLYNNVCLYETPSEAQVTVEETYVA